jgi:hypothetical protein
LFSIHTNGCSEFVLVITVLLLQLQLQTRLALYSAIQSVLDDFRRLQGSIF